jgi:hypothetical protein
VCRLPYEFVKLKAEADHYQRCAVTIQRVYRGYLVRRNMRKLTEPGTLLYKRWILARAEKASTRLASAIEDQSDAVDAILATIDRELDWARNVMKSVEERAKDIDWKTIKDSYFGREMSPCPICLREIQKEECTLTSCCHGFHTQCLVSWIQFCRNADQTPTCPCCRSPFQHRPLIPPAPAVPRLEPRSMVCL